MTAPATIRAPITTTVLVRRLDPHHHQDEPDRGQDRPDRIERRSGRRGSGIVMLRLSKTMTTMTSAWNTKAARQLIAVVIRPPMSGPAAAPMPPIPLIAPKARASRPRR